MFDINIIQTIDVNAVSMVVLFVLLATIRNKLDDRLIQYRLFRLLLWTNILLTLLEILGWIFDASAGAAFDQAWTLNLLANMALYSMAPVPAAIWFLYAHYQIFHDASRLRRTFFFLIPLLFLNLLLTLLSFKTGWFFSIDAANHYSRGPQFWIHVTIAFSFVIAACLMVLINRELLDKRSFKALLLFIVPQVVGSALQVLIFGLSMNWVAMMVSILIVYLNIQDRGLNTDFLTGTYNRRHFEQIISNRIRRIGIDQSFAVILCDMDQFKLINDRFGHQAGDEALQNTVQLLRRILRKDDLIARFGGDEFYLLLDLADEIALKVAITRIYQEFDHFNHRSPLPYQLELSMGGSIYDPRSNQTADQFLRQVDQLMYQEKARRRSHAHSGPQPELEIVR